MSQLSILYNILLPIYIECRHMSISDKTYAIIANHDCELCI